MKLQALEQQQQKTTTETTFSNNFDDSTKLEWQKSVLNGYHCIGCFTP